MCTGKLLLNVFFMAIDGNLTGHKNLHGNGFTINFALSVVNLAVSFDHFLRGEYSLVEFDLQFRRSLIEAAPGLDVVLVLLVDIFLLLFIWLTDHESGLVLEVIFSREVKLGLDDIFSSGHRLGFNLLVFVKE